ncbi:unnamed protein product, partial [Mesorhabditis spiculigera]
MCNAGYYRNTAGNCILERDCPPTCPGLSTWQTCSSYCEPTCANPNPVCNRACAPAKCQCNPGYYRSPSGLCVQWNQCYMTTTTTRAPLNCANVLCAPGTYCVQTTTGPRCQPVPPAVTCDTLKCAVLYKCEERRVSERKLKKDISPKSR